MTRAPRPSQLRGWLRARLVTRALGAGLAFLALLLTAEPAFAHARSASYSTWWLDARGATVRARVSLLDANALAGVGISREAPSGATSLLEHLPAVLSLTSAGGPCGVAPGSPREVQGQDGCFEAEWRVLCPSSDALRLHSDLVVDVNPTHLHFARVVGLAGQPERGFEGVLDARQRELDLPTRAEPAGVLTGSIRFVRLGIEHIASGWDHLVFVLMLVLAGATFRRTALVVSGFTLGHSITLSLATLGVVVPHAGPIEALIGLSIVVLAVENVWLAGRDRSLGVPVILVLAVSAVALFARWRGLPGALAFLGAAVFAGSYFGLLRARQNPDALRALVAALFGLVHGFGFARVLGEMHLPTGELARGLIGFNVGVELGQLAFIALAWPLVRLLRADSRRAEPWLAVVSAAGLAAGAFWFLSRALA